MLVESLRVYLHLNSCFMNIQDELPRDINITDEKKIPIFHIFAYNRLLINSII